MRVEKRIIVSIGWTDDDLFQKGREEAKAAGVVVNSEGETFDVAYTSGSAR
jgi:2,3-bisphosphoglycerate-dependent phosphoglycerate mutase